MPSESATGWRWFDRCVWRGYESPPRLAWWPRPSWGATLFGVSLLMLFAQWWWLGSILTELQSDAGEESHRVVWIYRYGMLLCLPGLIYGAGHARWGWVGPALLLLLPLAVAGTRAWEIGRVGVPLAAWHHDLLHSRIGDSSSSLGALVAGSQMALPTPPLDWAVGTVLRTGLLGSSSLSLVWLQAAAVGLSVLALERLLCLDLEACPRLRRTVLYAYAVAHGWSALLFDVGLACVVPLLLFSFVWSLRRCYRRRTKFYGLLLLCTGLPGALLLCGSGLLLLFRRRSGVGLLALGVGLLAVSLFTPAPLSGISPPEMGGLINAFSEHDRHSIALLTGFAALPLFAPEILIAAFPAWLGSLRGVPGTEWMWPGMGAALLIPLLALATGQVLQRWIYRGLPGLWLAGALLLVLSTVRALEVWPKRLEEIPAVGTEVAALGLFASFVEKDEGREWSDPARSNLRMVVPGHALEHFSGYRSVTPFPVAWEQADLVLLDLARPSWPSFGANEQDHQQTVLQVHRSPEWGLVAIRDGAALFLRAQEDRVALVLEEDRWDAGIVSYELPRSVVPSQRFRGTVEVENFGLETWEEDRRIGLGTVGERDSFVQGGTGRAFLPSSAMRGDRVFLRLPAMQAPEQPGLYVTRWRMIQENVRWFGDILEVTVEVTENARIDRETGRSAGELRE